jgi:hypothetical protein
MYFAPDILSVSSAILLKRLAKLSVPQIPSIAKQGFACPFRPHGSITPASPKLRTCG